MNTEEWISAAIGIKSLQDRLNELLVLSAKDTIGEAAKACPRCNKIMVPYAVWQQMPAEVRPSVFGCECSGEGLCASCAGRERAKVKAARTGGPLSEEEVRRLRAAVNFSGKGAR